VRGNKGSAGIDRMRSILGDYLKLHWPCHSEQLLNEPTNQKPVRRVKSEPDGGGVPKAWHPTVLDRFIQQAVMQVLQKQWNPTFSQLQLWVPTASVGASRRGSSAAIYCARHGWVIDLDLEKFFDRVNHDQTDGPDRQARRG